MADQLDPLIRTIGAALVIIVMAWTILTMVATHALRPDSAASWRERVTRRAYQASGPALLLILAWRWAA